MPDLDSLQKRIPDPLITDPEKCYSYSFDGSKWSFLPLAVIQAQTGETVRQTLIWCNKNRVPVVTRGAGSSLTGSASAILKGLVLDMSQWNDFSLDTISGMATVGPGTVVGTLQDAAAEKGWYYPPAPSSRNYLTLGGNIACNAGGLTGAKYGVTRDYVLALEGFLPQGEFVRLGRPLRKFAAGYNLRDLWIGSEGTLGVITKATLKLLPHPESRRTFLLAFDQENNAIRFVRNLLEARQVPSILELLDQLTVKGAMETTGKTFIPGVGQVPMILMELDGDAEQVKRNARAVEEILGNQEGLLGKLHTDDPDEAESFWEVRRSCSSAMFRLGPHKLNEDIVVPLDQQENLFAKIRELSTRTGIPMPTFGHAADGNFHVNIMYNRDDTAIRQQAADTLRELMESVIALGGAISGEHGIGLAKSSFMQFQHSPAELAAMKAIKTALDPMNILNPGKIFDPFEPWEHQPEKVRLPWDKHP